MTYEDDNLFNDDLFSYDITTHDIISDDVRLFKVYDLLDFLL
jgi:hypothetical protein